MTDENKTFLNMLIVHISKIFTFLALCLPMDSIYYSYLLCYSTGSIEIHRFLPNMLIKVSYKFEYKKGYLSV